MAPEGLQPGPTLQKPTKGTMFSKKGAGLGEGSLGSGSGSGSGCSWLPLNLVAALPRLPPAVSPPLGAARRQRRALTSSGSCALPHPLLASVAHVCYCRAGAGPGLAGCQPCGYSVYSEC